MGRSTLSNEILIEGVTCVPLKQIKDDRGSVMHHLNFKSPTFQGFEEVYISKTFSGKVKAWKQHLKMTQNFCVPVGAFKFVLFDNREGSPTKNIINEFLIDEEHNYSLLCIPPKVWYGFHCVSEHSGIIVNLSNLLFDPAEVVKLDVINDTIPYREFDGK
jgi:dTDP-4-dehydrorhamnose 3,5-epimerase